MERRDRTGPPLGRCGPAVLGLIAGLALPASAQRITGVVVDGESSARVADVPVVVVTSAGKVAGAGRTSPNGWFVVDLKQTGKYTLRVLRLGYRPTDFSFEARDTATIHVEVALGQLRAEVAQQLNTVVVNGRQIEVSARYAEVVERARRANGALFTHDDFVETNDVAFALGTLPTVHVNGQGDIVFAKCDRVQVWVNGIRYFAPGDSPREVLKLVAPGDIELMEVYTGVARLPAEYINDACAAIAVWTK